MAAERRRFKQSLTLQDRLIAWSGKVREQAGALPSGPHRDELLKKARQAELPLTWMIGLFVASAASKCRASRAVDVSSAHKFRRLVRAISMSSGMSSARLHDVQDHSVRSSNGDGAEGRTARDLRRLLLTAACWQRTGHHEEDGCWRSFKYPFRWRRFRLCLVRWRRTLLQKSANPFSSEPSKLRPSSIRNVNIIWMRR
jgi:hypothetical protein